MNLSIERICNGVFYNIILYSYVETTTSQASSTFWYPELNQSNELKRVWGPKQWNLSSMTVKIERNK